MIAIPTRFRLGGRTWEVKLRDVVDDDVECLGLCDPDDAIIYLKSGLKHELLQHSFYHELSHAICFTLGWDELNEDEGKIDALAGMLYQYLSTKKRRLA
jgi:hypothetical protein